MKTGDMVMWRDEKFGHHRFWEVLSICLGAEKQESLIELRAINYTPGVDTEGKRHTTTWVPEPFLRGAEIYERMRVVK